MDYTPMLFQQSTTHESSSPPQQQVSNVAFEYKGALVGPYSKVGGHHIHAKAGFKDNKKYNLNKAFCISQKFITKNRLNHQDMTNMQRKLFNQLAKDVRNGTRVNSLTEHTTVAKTALMNGGADVQMTQYLVGCSLKNLEEQGVTEPTNIPWNN